MTPKFLRTAVVLGLLSAIGPFAIDMYLPALPSIGENLGASTAAVQMSLLVFFLSMGFGQIVVGPISDMIGRKAPLYVGLALFAAGGIGSALAPTIEWLIAFRFIQGLGACAGMVVPRAIVRDLHTGTEAARLMSLLMLVFSVSPILAPLTGSLVIESFGWRAVFWVVTGAALLATVLLATSLKETRPAEHRVDSSFGSALAGYKFLLGDRNFLGLTFIGGFGIVELLRLSGELVLHPDRPLRPVAAGLQRVLLDQRGGLHRHVAADRDADRAVRAAARRARGGRRLRHGDGGAACRGGVRRRAALRASRRMLFVGYGFLGLVIPTTSVLAMEEHGEIAGTASALMGTLHFATGAVAMAVAGTVLRRHAAADGRRHHRLRGHRLRDRAVHARQPPPHRRCRSRGSGGIAAVRTRASKAGRIPGLFRSRDPDGAELSPAPKVSAPALPIPDQASGLTVRRRRGDTNIRHSIDRLPCDGGKHGHARPPCRRAPVRARAPCPNRPSHPTTALAGQAPGRRVVGISQSNLLEGLQIHLVTVAKYRAPIIPAPAVACII